MSDPNNRRAYDAGELAYQSGEPRRCPDQWQRKYEHWIKGWDAAEAYAEQETLATEGSMPEEQITWLRQNLRLERDFYPAAGHGVMRFHLKLGDETLSTLEFAK